MPKKESEQFGDSNHKGIFKKILNKLIIIRDYEKKLLIKNKSIASEGYHDSNDKLDERISALRGIMFDPIALIFGVLGVFFVVYIVMDYDNRGFNNFFDYLNYHPDPFGPELFMIGVGCLIYAWIRFRKASRYQKTRIQELTNEKNNNKSKRKHKFKLEKKIESVWKEIDILEKKYVKESQNYFTKKYDKNKNRKLDVVEDSHDYMNLLDKHQEKIISISEKMGEDYIHTLVKVDEKLNLKKESLNLLLNKILNYEGRFNEKSNIEVFEELLKKEINFYNVLLNASLFMASSLINDDRIGFRKLYQLFDKMNFFNSNYENKVLELFSNINENLNTIIHKIDDMNFSIVGAIQDLSYVTEKGMDNLSNDLKSVNSSINLNNLIAGINAYQNYKTNQRLK